MTNKSILNNDETSKFFDAANERNRRIIIEAMARKGMPAGTLQERVHRLLLSNRPGTSGEIPFQGEAPEDEQTFASGWDWPDDYGLSEPTL